MELKKAMLAIHAYELELSRALLSALEAIPGLQLYGFSDPNRLEDLPPRKVAEQLAEQGIYVWDGNYYALNVTEGLGVEESGGMIRVGAAHYNTLSEVERLKESLMRTAG